VQRGLPVDSIASIVASEISLRQPTRTHGSSPERIIRRIVITWRFQRFATIAGGNRIGDVS
jgi:hypothetical protein